MTRSAQGVSSASEPAWPATAISTIFQDAKQAAGCSNRDDTSTNHDSAAEQLKQLCLGHQVPRPICRSHQSSVLTSCNLAAIADYILAGKARNIVVMAGAGISVSSGIPDFRSPGTGLYSQLERFNLPWPEAVFDIRFFRHNPKPFYLLAKELFPGGYCPTPAHFFLQLLHKKGLLLTAFTQNIDGLEQLAGLPAEKVVPAHGSFDGAHCIDCGRACSVYAVQQAVYDDAIAHCDSCGGLVKPDIVFFGEPLPARFHRRRLADLQQADLLIVMGTSLVVQPFASMIDAVPTDCPRLLINMTKVGERKEQQQAAPVATFRHKQRHNSSSSDSSSDSSSSGSDSDDSASNSGFESDATALTASSSYINMCDEGSPAAAALTNTSSSTAESAPGQRSTAAAAESAGGFDFDSGYRDVLQLGDCDAGVKQLAALLGWSDEFERLIQQGRAAFEEARAEWEDA